MNAATACSFHGRRPAIAFVALFALVTNLLHPSLTRAQRPLWEVYKDRFVTAEGRVVDTANGGISHSESQGYGLLLAQAHEDRAAFEKIWRWTIEHLGVRDDALFAWRWERSKGVADRNNATDGDLLIAWALCRAANLWKEPKWRRASVAIAKDVRTKMRVSSSFGDLVLPGGTGFKNDGGAIVNLSYWLFPGFVDLEGVDPSPVWRALTKSGLALLREARFSRWRLPPDWLLVKRSELRVAPGRDPDFGYNAIRVPLNLAWAGFGDAALYEPFRGFDRAAGYLLPRATVALPAGVPGEAPALPGMLAIYRLVAGTGNLKPNSLSAPYHSIAPDEPYFSASLGLLSNLAASEAKKFSKSSHK